MTRNSGRRPYYDPKYNAWGIVIWERVQHIHEMKFNMNVLLILMNWFIDGYVTSMSATEDKKNRALIILNIHLDI